MRYLPSILIGSLCAMHAASGGIIVSAPASEWADSGKVRLTESEKHGSIDLREHGAGNSLGLTEGASAAVIHPERETAGTVYSFMLENNVLNGRAAWALDGVHADALTPDPPFSDVYPLQVEPGSSSLSITNSTLLAGGDEAVIGAFAAPGAVQDATLPYIHVNTSEGLLSDLDFLLEGTLIFDWTGTVPLGEEDMGMQVELTQIPEPATLIMVILASLSGMFIRRRFR